jgi:hypothetical protein
MISHALLIHKTAQNPLSKFGAALKADAGQDLSTAVLEYLKKMFAATGCNLSAHFPLSPL